MLRSTFFISTLLVFITAATRLVPHPPNFTPLIAISLFSGAYIQNRFLAAVVPISAMALSDIFLGYYNLLFPIYGIIVLISLLGRGLQMNRQAIRVGAYTLSGSLIFYLASNFLVWLTSGMYPISWSGLVQCYVMAIPFYQNQILGDIVYSGSLFGVMYYLERSSLVPVRVASRDS